MHSGANPRLVSAVHWVVMWPTTAEVRDPWTPSIRLSAPALASDTHKTSARDWKHATGKCINVRETLEPYKIICRHFVQHLTCIQRKCVCMQVNTHQCGRACEYIVINVSRAETLPNCGFVCVQTELSVTHTHTHTDSNIVLICRLSHTCPLLRHTQAVFAETPRIRTAPHTCRQYVCGGGSADRLAVTVKLAPFSCRCQVFCLAVGGRWGVSLCQECWVAVNGRERMG